MYSIMLQTCRNDSKTSIIYAIMPMKVEDTTQLLETILNISEMKGIPMKLQRCFALGLVRALDEPWSYKQWYHGVYIVLQALSLALEIPNLTKEIQSMLQDALVKNLDRVQFCAASRETDLRQCSVIAQVLVKRISPTRQ